MNASAIIEPPKVPQPRVAPKKKALYLTESQEQALAKLDHYAEVFLLANGSKFGGITPRTKVLLLGGTGSGKTSVCRRFAEQRRWSFLSIDSSAWVPEGSAKPATLLFLRNHVRALDNSYERGVILFDELCKLLPAGSAALETNWSTSCFGEVLCALDIDERLLGHGWTQADLEKFRTRFFVVGAGAFQFYLKDARRKARKGSLGFGSDDSEPQDFAEFLDQAEAIPSEISTRFASPAVFIDSPTREDYQRVIAQIHDDTGIPMKRSMGELAAEACEFVGGMRWAENYVTSLLFEHPEAGRTKSSGAPGKQAATEKSSPGFGEAIQRYDFFSPDSANHVRLLNDDVFALHRVLARMISTLAVTHADKKLTTPPEEEFWVYLNSGGTFSHYVSRVLPACTICTDVSAELTDNLPLQELTVKLWDGIRSVSPELQRCGLLDLWHDGFDLCNRVCQRRHHLSVAVANGRFRS